MHIAVPLDLTTLQGTWRDSAAHTGKFNVRASGGTGFYSNRTLTAGVALAPGASAWSSVSDVNLKEALPRPRWRRSSRQDCGNAGARVELHRAERHDSAPRPDRADFQAAFGLGESAVRISTVDADGIALRAIQALESRTRADSQMVIWENAALRAALEALQARLDGLEQKRD